MIGLKLVVCRFYLYLYNKLSQVSRSTFFYFEFLTVSSFPAGPVAGSGDSGYDSEGYCGPQRRCRVCLRLFKNVYM